MKIFILVDQQDSWFCKYAVELKSLLNFQEHDVHLIQKADIEYSGDICFMLSCENIVKKEFLNRFSHCIVVHASDLPKGKGFSPLQWQILEGADSIVLTLFEAIEALDAGPYYLKRTLQFEGHELLNELHRKVACEILDICCQYVKEFSILKPIFQEGIETFYPRLKKEDDRIDINKSIKSQWNHFRIADNERHPLWFEHMGYEYELKIEKRKVRDRMVDNRETPINKGNYSMESPERESKFEQYRGEEWGGGYKKYRSDWVQCAKERKLLEYPLCVDIELSTVCNLKCPMCFTILSTFQQKVEKKFMEADIFKKIIDEIAGKVPSIRLSLRGESTLHPQFVEYIKYAKKAGIYEISFLTNGSTLTEDYFTEIMLAGADWITISIDGLDEEYESIRKPLKFVDTLNKIKAIKRIKEEYKRNRPVIKIQTIWPAIRKNPERFYQTFKPYVDLIAFNPLMDFSEQENQPICIENFSCPQIYQRIIVSSSGKVIPCTNDEDESIILGDVKQDTIYSIWHGKRLNELRMLHDSGNFQLIKRCKGCFISRKTEETERAFVEGREIVVQDYIKNN